MTEPSYGNRIVTKLHADRPDLAGRGCECLTCQPRVTTRSEAEDIIHLASQYFAGTLVGCSYQRACDLILQAAEMLR